MLYDTNNVFAKILRGELPCKKVYEDEFALAFEDIAPDAPVHVLVITREPYVSFHDFAANASKDTINGFFVAVQKTAALLGAQNKGYRIVANHGPDANQLVPHFHMHILAGHNLGGIVTK